MAFLPHECLGAFASNVALLSGIVLLHIVFLCVEMLAFRYSHSLSLLSDALHSALDIGTYGINLLAEYHISRASSEYIPLSDGPDKTSAAQVLERRKASADWWEMVGVVSTAAALLVSTFYVFYEAAERVIESKLNEEINEDILIWIVVPMVLLNGLFIAIFCCIPGIGGHSHSHGHSHGCDSADEMNTNMFSAFSHVLADQFHNVALLVIAVLVKCKVGNPITVDAVGSVITGILTAILAFAVIHSTWKKASAKAAAKANGSTALKVTVENSKENNHHCNGHHSHHC